MSRKLKVVVAHHEKVIADTLAIVLRQSNVEVATAYTGVSGLELVLSTNPDVAILCIVPTYDGDLNGVYAAVVVRALMPACRLLLYPGGSGSWVVEPLKTAEARGYEFELLMETTHPTEIFRLLGEQTGGDIEPIQSPQPESQIKKLFKRLTRDE
jgi:hypothetical protein